MRALSSSLRTAADGTGLSEASAWEEDGVGHAVSNAIRATAHVDRIPKAVWSKVTSAFNAEFLFAYSLKAAARLK